MILYMVLLIDGEAHLINEPVSYDGIVKRKIEFFKVTEVILILKIDFKNNKVKTYEKGDLTISAEFMYLEE